MSVAPYPIQCYRDSKWVELQTDKLLPGDVVSVCKSLPLFLRQVPAAKLL
jgi:magnesium-transporting ATPase (P-type)